MTSRYQQRKKRIHGLVSLSEYVESCCSKISKKLMNTSKVHLRVFALFYFEKDDVYNSLSVIQIVVLCKR